jgi:hypothetical protein
VSGIPADGLLTLRGWNGGLSRALDPEVFRRTAFFADEREILEFATEQNWYDTDNGHFRPADRTRRGIPCFPGHFLINHIISFRRKRRNGCPTGSLIRYQTRG